MKYIIEFAENGEFNFETISESLCRQMCGVHDNGERYTESSRYNYYWESYKQSKSGIGFGTAKACIQSYLIDNDKTYLNFDVYSTTPNGSRLKIKVLKKPKSERKKNI